MEDQVRDILKRLINDYGEELPNDKRRFRALLNDYCENRWHQEVNIISHLFTLSLFIETLKNRNIPFDDRDYRRFVIKAYQELGMAEELAEWGIIIWAEALEKRVVVQEKPVIEIIEQQNLLELTLSNTLIEHQMAITKVKISNDKRYFVSASLDNKISIFLVDKWKKKNHIINLDSSVINDFDLDFNSRNVIACTNNGSIILWNIDNLVKIKKFKATDYSINTITFSKDGSLAIGGGEDGSIYIWRTVDGFLIRIKDQHIKSINEIIYSEKRDVFATISKDEKIKIWQLKNNDIHNLKELSIPNVIAAKFSNDGQKLFSLNNVDKVQIWNIDTGKEIGFIHFNLSNAKLFTISKDNKYLAIANNYGTLEIIDMEKNKTVFSQKTYKTDVSSMEFHGRFLVCGYSSGVIRVFTY